MRMILTGFYSHPWAWNEIGFGGPAYPRGFMRLGALGPREPYESAPARPTRIRSASSRAANSDGRLVCAEPAQRVVGPKDNDSRFLLDVHSRELPGEDTMCRYDDDDEVDMVIVGAGAGGSVLAQRLARAGWRIVIIEAGPFWHPDEDWVSDEAGSHGCTGRRSASSAATTPSSSARTTPAAASAGRWCTTPDTPLASIPSDFQT